MISNILVLCVFFSSVSRFRFSVDEIRFLIRTECCGISANPLVRLEKSFDWHCSSALMHLPSPQMTASDVNLGLKKSPHTQSQTERRAALAAWASGLIESVQRTADEIAFPSSSTSCVCSCAHSLLLRLLKTSSRLAGETSI